MRQFTADEGRAIWRAFLLATTVTLCGPAASAQDGYPAQPGKDWPIYGGSYNNQRYSSLKEITPANARTLQGKPMQTIGVMLPELGEGYHSQVMRGVGDHLLREGFFYFTVHHRHKTELVATYTDLLRSRGVDGIIAIDRKSVG